MNPRESSPTFNYRSFEDPLSPTDYSDTEQFCTPDSLVASSNYINILLTSYGYPVPLIFNSNQAQDHCKIVNCLYALLQDRKNDAAERQELIYEINEQKKQQLELETTHINLQRDLHVKEQSIKEQGAKLEAMRVSMEKVSIQNTRLKEEISKVKNNMQYMKTQYAKETSRHEQELAKTQDRIVKCMNHHYKIKQASTEITSHLATTTNLIETDEIAQVHKKYIQVASQANERETNLKSEVENLKTGLARLYTDVRRFLETLIRRSDKDTVELHDTTYNETARFHLPLDHGGKEAFNMTHDLLARIKEIYDKQMDQKSQLTSDMELAEKNEIIHALESDLTELTENFLHAKELHDKEIQMYKRFEQGGFFDTLYPTPKDAYISDSEDDSKYELLKKKAMREQKKVTESAIELGNQRAQLQAQRWAFEEMKRELQLKDILQDSPAGPPPPPLSQQPTFTFEPSERPRKRKSGWLGAAPSNN